MVLAIAFFIGALGAGMIVFLYSRRQIQNLWVKTEGEAQRLQAELQLREDRIQEVQQQFSAHPSSLHSLAI